VTVATILQRLRDERGLAVSYASLRRYVAANLPEEVRRAQVTVLNPYPVEPGGQGQIDYGRLGPWVDPGTGRRHTVQAFAMVLCCSRHMFLRPVVRMDQHTWTACHVAAFAFFGGAPARSQRQPATSRAAPSATPTGPRAPRHSRFSPFVRLFTRLLTLRPLVLATRSNDTRDEDRAGRAECDEDRHDCLSLRHGARRSVVLGVLVQNCLWNPTASQHIKAAT